MSFDCSFVALSLQKSFKPHTAEEDKRVVSFLFLVGLQFLDFWRLTLVGLEGWSTARILFFLV